MGTTDRAKSRKKRVLKSKAERRQEIVDVTVALLAEHGVQGTSISRIADAVGMSKGALYYHFPNHEALLTAAMDAIDETATDWITEPSAEDAASRLSAIGEAHSRWTLSARNTFLRPFFQLISSNRDDTLASRVSAKRRVYFDRLVEIVEEGQREGTIVPDVDPREVAYALLGHAWAEDVAFLQGDEEYITEGMSRNILRRLLASYIVPDPSSSPGCRRAD